MKKGLFFIMALALFVLMLPVFAEEENPVEPVLGSWMLDCVYENASDAQKVILDPETSASLYMESSNVYTFNPDGSAVQLVSGGGDTVIQNGTWEKHEDVYTFDTDDGTPMEFKYEKNQLHRYWQDENPDAVYHDLEFVYSRVPVGAWKMTQVFTGTPGSEKTLLDPENAASLYSESTNVYKWNHDGTGALTIYEAGEVAAVEEFTWSRESIGLFVLKTGDFDMMFTYDPDEDVLYRYWNSDTTDSMYDNLEFVYTRTEL